MKIKIAGTGYVGLIRVTDLKKETIGYVAKGGSENSVPF